jgi:hypothetical protein
MKTQTTETEYLAITNSILETVSKVIGADLAYEQATNCGRKFGITGEVGEILVCHALGLQLVKDPRTEGFDAVDGRGSRIQIKARRGEKTDLPKVSGRLSRFSKHQFDYALLGILSRDYKLVEVWKANYTTLKPIIGKHKRANPTIRQFKNAGKQVYP